MPKTKTTPCKHPVDSIICPVCKEDIRGQNFNSHIVKCADSRHKCQCCAKTFKKAEYLKQHMKRKHQKERVETVVSDLSVSSSSESSDDEGEKKDDSDWNSDPKVELGEEQNVTSQCEIEEDKRSVRDISTGRIIRKPCEPAPVFNPVKRRKVEETENNLENRSVQKVVVKQKENPRQGLKDLPVIAFKNSKTSSANETYSESTARNKDRSEDDIQAKNRMEPNSRILNKTQVGGSFKTADVTVIVKKDINVTQEIIVHDNGEKVQTMWNTLKGKAEKEEPVFNLGSVLPPGAMIKPENVLCKRVITEDGGRISFELKYE